MRIHTLDLHFQNHPGLIAAYLIESAGQFALIETGPGACHDQLTSEIRARGFSPDDIKHVFVTHIHLDHSGAAGWWAQSGATVHCHPLAAKHLIDPARLIDSARMIYAERMDTLWGPILPAPAERVRALEDNESVSIGDISITAWDTPGHARHHHAFVIGDICFTGDVAGMRLQDSSYISVTAAPPQFDPPAYLASINRLLAARFSKLQLTHFGAVADPAGHLQRYRARVIAVHERVSALVKSDASESEIRAAYLAAEHAEAVTAGVTPEDWLAYESANSTSMCADGVRLFCTKSLE